LRPLNLISQKHRPHGYPMNFRILVLLIFLGVFMAGAGEKKDWRLVNSADTLLLFMDNQVLGRLVHSMAFRDSLIVKETVLKARNWMQGNAENDTLTIFEKRYYKTDGYIDSAFQKVVSASGESSWQLATGGDIWHLSVTAGGMTAVKKVQPFSEHINHLYDIYNNVKNGTDITGRQWSDTAFELTSGVFIHSVITCISSAEKHKGKGLWFFNASDNMTLRNERWILDHRGNTVLREIAPVFTARKEWFTDEKKAHVVDTADGVFKIPAPALSGRRQRLRLTLSGGVDLDSSVMLFYEQHKNAWLLKKSAQNCVFSKKTTNNTPSMPGGLSPTVTIQSNHEKIVKIAKEIAGTATAPCTVVARCNNYVYRKIIKRNTATFSSAVETLEAGFGDCGEHAVLLAALLRALQIEAHVILGLVYVADSDCYMYHAWVWLPGFGGSFTFADPAFGKFPAEKSLIPLIMDDTGEKAVYLTRLIGRISLTSVK